VESYIKWYTLFLVHPDGKVEPITYLELPEPGYADHEPHPVAVRKLAESRGWFLCPEAEELILSRWLLSCCELTSEEVLDYLGKGRNIQANLEEAERERDGLAVEAAVLREVLVHALAGFKEIVDAGKSTRREIQNSALETMVVKAAKMLERFTRRGG